MAVSEEQLAAAIMAKITGNNLKKIDESSISPVTPGMNANRLDPMSFISRNVPTGPSPLEIQAMQQMNMEAERLYPLPNNPAPIPQMPPDAVNLPYVVEASKPQSTPVTISDSVITREDIVSIRSQLERTNATLTKMSGMLGKVFASFTEKNKLNNSD